MSIQKEIEKLKKEKNAVILAHNYQLPEIQDIADFVGDSLNLSIQAKNTNADIIVFCGVYFMAETAKILAPGKKVLIPNKEAGCPMADMITAHQLKKWKEAHPRAKVLCYVNTPAEVKAESYVCCTSANSVEVVKKAFKEEEVIFVPDQHLANYTQLQTGYKFIIWPGYCPVHVNITPQDIKKQKELHPSAEVLVHPECVLEVIKLADEVLSTEGMCRYVKKSQKREIIIGTEIGILYRLQKENPDKKFYPASELAVCSTMKMITLEEVLKTLEEERHEVYLSSSLIRDAQQSIYRMLEL